jgi:DNA polymerase III epsilon subunit-like protein
MALNKNNFIFYDLETNGLDYYTTGIMQITMLDIEGNIILNQYVYPYDKRIDGTQIHGIDEQKLIDNNAISTYNLCNLVINIIFSKYGNNPVYLIGYNNFGYDQIILENNFKICNLNIPQNLYFIDIYPIIKELYPKMKPNFKLSTVYENLCKSKEDNTPINFHCALADTTCLYKIYKVIDSNGNEILLKKYLRPLLQSKEFLLAPIYTLGGYISSLDKKFYSNDIKSIGNMYDVFKKMEYNDQIYELYLRNKLNIYSDFLIHTFIKNMKIIRYFLNE